MNSSKAKIAGHPIHPMLVAFPIAFYVAAFLSYVLYAASAVPFWFEVAFLANIAGVALAVLAAIPGFIDWAFGIPFGTPAKRTGLLHLIVNVSALAAFSLCAWLNYDQFGMPLPLPRWTISLSLIGVIFMGFGGLLGWKLIGMHHVGIELTQDQKDIDLKRSA